MMRAPDADVFDLSRFVDAQSAIYARVIEELSAGQKRSHWSKAIEAFYAEGSDPATLRIIQ